MNRLGVVLAADSATTVKYWNGNAEEVRYFKGANKIFQLCDYRPVGIMIYNAVEALRVPWEVIIKEFRRELGSKSFNSISDYADAFLSIVNQNERLFPADARRSEFEDVLGRATYKFAARFRADKDDGKATEFHAYIDGGAGMAPISQDKVRIDIAVVPQLVRAFGELVQRKLEFWLEFFGINSEQLTDAEIEMFICAALREIPISSPSTGLVLAGFGDHSVFPEVVHLKNCQFWFEQFAEEERTCERTSYDVPAFISGYAQTSMIDTLRMGFSYDVLHSVDSDARKHCSQLVDTVLESTQQVLQPGEKEKLVNSTVNNMIEGLFGHAFGQHSVPLRRVVGVLPLDEMSALAETLINLQSLKEKVTKPSETVGGPVDVAAITRAEGLVWIKRKHFFNPDINSRYFERRGRA